MRLPGFSCARSSACHSMQGLVSCQGLYQTASQIKHAAALACTWKAVVDTRGTAPSSRLRERLSGAAASHYSGTATWVAKVPALLRMSELQLCGSMP